MRMRITSFQGAKTLCHLTGWRLTNLELHKILYLCHVMYLGRNNEPLFGEHFEAWDYGPVLPLLYNKVRCFGADRIIDIFGVPILDVKNKEEKKAYGIIKEFGIYLADYTPRDLVNLTHRPGGAWDKNYKEGERDVIIPTEDIKEEYDNLYGPKK